MKKYGKNSIRYIKQAILSKSQALGEYPFPVVSVVDHPVEGDGGMEYPMVTLIGTSSHEKLLDYVINHEVGHNWFIWYSCQ
jgi:aminopeptidase N